MAARELTARRGVQPMIEAVVLFIGSRQHWQMEDTTSNRLDRPVQPDRDHILGTATAAISLVEYGSYACPHCRAANERIADVRDRLGDRMQYVFRHRPLTGSELARRAAEL